MKIKVITDKCTGCGACIFQCPNNALEMTYHNGEYNNLKKVISHISLCDATAKCIDYCRYNALILE